MIFGIAIREIRLTLDLNQEQFAKLFGVHPLTVSRWERSAMPPEGSSRQLLLLLESCPSARSGTVFRVGNLLAKDKNLEALWELLKDVTRDAAMPKSGKPLKKKKRN